MKLFIDVVSDATSLSIVDMSANIGVVKRIIKKMMNILNIVQSNKITRK